MSERKGSGRYPAEFRGPFVETAGTDLGDMRTSAALISRELITVVLRLYRQGDAAMRTRRLDIIDRLAEFSAYDLELALESKR